MTMRFATMTITLYDEENDNCELFEKNHYSPVHTPHSVYGGCHDCGEDAWQGLCE